MSNVKKMIDWLVFNANFSNISAILCHHTITSSTSVYALNNSMSKL